MSAPVALLVALVVHLAGVELDQATEATLQRYDGSALTTVWSLREAEDGVYRFAARDDAVGGGMTVERLRGRDMVYAVLDGRAGSETRAAAVVDLSRYREQMRPSRDAGEVIRLAADDALVAAGSAGMETTTTAADVEPADRNDAPGESPPAGAVESDPRTPQTIAELTLVRGPGQWTAAAADADLVVTLRTN